MQEVYKVTLSTSTSTMNLCVKSGIVLTCLDITYVKKQEGSYENTAGKRTKRYYNNHPEKMYTERVTIIRHQK